MSEPIPGDTQDPVQESSNLYSELKQIAQESNDHLLEIQDQHSKTGEAMEDLDRWKNAQPGEEYSQEEIDAYREVAQSRYDRLRAKAFDMAGKYEEGKQQKYSLTKQANQHFLNNQGELQEAALQDIRAERGPEATNFGQGEQQATWSPEEYQQVKKLLLDNGQYDAYDALMNKGDKPQGN